MGDLLFGGTTANNDSSAPKLNKASTSSPSSVLGVPSPLLRPPLPSPPPRPSLPLELPGTSSENSVSGRDALGGKGFKGAVGAGALLEIVAEPGERDGGGAAVGGEEGAVRNREGSRADAGQQAQQEQQQPLMANHGYQVRAYPPLAPRSMFVSTMTIYHPQLGRVSHYDNIPSSRTPTMP